MRKNSLVKSLAVALPLALALNACGGGGGASTNTSSNTGGGTPTGGGGNTMPCSAGLTAVETAQIFPADNPWNTDIAQAAVDTRSAAIISFPNQPSSPGVFADFGSGTYNGAPIGIPFVVVCGDQAAVAVTYRANSQDGNYGDESDPGPFPIPLTAPIEGNGIGDSHVLTVDLQNHKLYELYNASLDPSGAGWQASSGARFDLSSNALRPMCWTSADAAGLPIFPGLVRFDEVASGVVDHPIRFTLQRSKVSPTFTTPARHQVSGTNLDTTRPTPMGMRLRLKASVAIGKYSARNQVIMTAMKHYGIILADIGSDFFISGAPDARWDNDDLRSLRAIKASDFEVVQMDRIYDPSVPADQQLCAP